jgi:hypothetical protein
MNPIKEEMLGCNEEGIPPTGNHVVARVRLASDRNVSLSPQQRVDYPNICIVS